MSQPSTLSVQVGEFIRQQPVVDLPGVGRSVASKLAKLRVVSCQDLQQKPPALLREEFGAKLGASLYKVCLDGGVPVVLIANGADERGAERSGAERLQKY